MLVLVVHSGRGAEWRGCILSSHIWSPSARPLLAAGNPLEPGCPMGRRGHNYAEYVLCSQFVINAFNARRSNVAPAVVAVVWCVPVVTVARCRDQSRKMWEQWPLCAHYRL